MTKKSYFLSADLQAIPTDISFLDIQNYALLFLSWTALMLFPFTGYFFKFPFFHFCLIGRLVKVIGF
jgi:hypothetical protein